MRGVYGIRIICRSYFAVLPKLQQYHKSLMTAVVLHNATLLSVLTSYVGVALIIDKWSCPGRNRAAHNQSDTLVLAAVV